MHGGKQRRIRQIRAILGRNIGWNSVEAIETPNHIDDTPAFSCTDTGRFNSQTTSCLPFTKPTAYSISPSLSSSASSSVSPSSAWLGPSPLHTSRSLQLAKSQVKINNSDNANSRGLHLGDSCPPNLSPLAESLQHNHPHPHHHPTPMRRSESATFLNTMTVADSSLTKNAYKRNSKTPDITSDSNRTTWDDQGTATPPNEDPCLWKEERGLLDAYLTLALDDRQDDVDLFYTSETIPNATNPAFRTDMALVDWEKSVQSMMVVRVWARHSLPESASMARRTDPVHMPGNHAHTNIVGPPYRLLIEWSVDLNELVFIGKSLYGTHSWPDNTLLFELSDGYYTSPDNAALALGQQKRIHHLDMHMDLDNASIASVQSPRIKRSYTYHHVMKLNTLQDCIFDAQRSADEVQSNINQILETEKDNFRLARERSQKETRLKELELSIKEAQDRTDQDRKRIDTLRKSLNHRKLQLKKSQERFQTGTIDLENNNTQLEKNIQMHNDTFSKLNERRKELIADLFSIYPIEQSFDDFTQFRIRGIYLPNSVYTGCNEEAVATALGYTSHLVYMLAIYLSIPLRYPINPMGSRASIYDPVSLINGSRSFALYGKGVDRYRFEFGVFLLNKNIEQMMNAYGLIVMDLRHTLPNIHYFIQAVLTTSLTSGPTSMSVLSISSYAQGREGPDCSNARPLTLSTKPAADTTDNQVGLTRDNDNSIDNHLTIQTSRCIPVPSSKEPIPSPTISSQRASYSSKYGISPGVHLSSHVYAAPAVLDTVTTSSFQNSNNQDSY